MGTYGITGWSAGGRKPLNYGLKAGQFRGMGKVNVFQSRTTVINNNYYNGTPGLYTNMYNCNYDTGLTKGEKWMLGLGAGTSILGTILGLFGLGKKDSVEGAGSAPEKKTEAPATRNVETPSVKTTETPSTKKVETEETEETEDNTQKPDYSAIKNGARMVCRDASGKTQNISGILSNVQTDANGVPQSFTLTDETSGNKYEYRVSTNSNGEITYECVSKNGQATIGAPTYTLENGELVNKESQNGFGFGIQTQAKTQKRTETTPQKRTQTKQTPSKTETPASQESKIQTLSDGTKVSDEMTMLTPYKHADGKYYSKQEKLAGFDTPWGNWTENNNNKTQTTKTTTNANNSKIELKYEYKDHKGHFYANGKEISQREYMKLQKEQEAQKRVSPETKNNTTHKLVNGQTVNIQGAKIGINPKANASQKDTFYLQTSDGQKINISRADYYNIKDKLE